MTQITLATLRAEFSTLSNLVKSCYTNGWMNHTHEARLTDPNILVAFVEDEKSYFMDAEAHGQRTAKLIMGMFRLAELIVIAELYEDEKEGIRAAMLYRLSNGNIDPRKQEGAA